jgi:hypothetical protein
MQPQSRRGLGRTFRTCRGLNSAGRLEARGDHCLAVASRLNVVGGREVRSTAAKQDLDHSGATRPVLAEGAALTNRLGRTEMAQRLVRRDAFQNRAARSSTVYRRVQFRIAEKRPLVAYLNCLHVLFTVKGSPLLRLACYK